MARRRKGVGELRRFWTEHLQLLAQRTATSKSRQIDGEPRTHGTAFTDYSLPQHPLLPDQATGPVEGAAMTFMSLPPIGMRS